MTCLLTGSRISDGHSVVAAHDSHKTAGRIVTIQLIKTSFNGSNRHGDFAWMIDQPEFARTLFVFNDNETQFYEHQSKIGNVHRCEAGGGNAVIRPYQCLQTPRATGIPTGRNGGYQSLSAESKQAIDAAVQHVDSLLGTGRYDSLAISWNERTHTLGTGIFDVDQSVLDYIVQQVHMLDGVR